jgi:hypothetical protein
MTTEIALDVNSPASCMTGQVLGPPGQLGGLPRIVVDVAPAPLKPT